jgi:head-tail adaptor
MNVQDVMPSRAEAVRTGLTAARNQTRCRYRYRTDVTGAMRIRISGAVERVLQIVGGPAEVGGRHEYSEVMCEAASS